MSSTRAPSLLESLRGLWRGSWLGLASLGLGAPGLSVACNGPPPLQLVLVPASFGDEVAVCQAGRPPSGGVCFEVSTESLEVFGSPDLETAWLPRVLGPRREALQSEQGELQTFFPLEKLFPEGSGSELEVQVQNSKDPGIAFSNSGPVASPSMLLQWAGYLPGKTPGPSGLELELHSVEGLLPFPRPLPKTLRAGENHRWKLSPGLFRTPAEVVRLLHARTGSRVLEEPVPWVDLETKKDGSQSLHVWLGLGGRFENPRLLLKVRPQASGGFRWFVSPPVLFPKALGSSFSEALGLRGSPQESFTAALELSWQFGARLPQEAPWRWVLEVGYLGELRMEKLSGPEERQFLELLDALQEAWREGPPPAGSALAKGLDSLAESQDPIGALRELLFPDTPERLSTELEAGGGLARFVYELSGSFPQRSWRGLQGLVGQGRPARVNYRGRESSWD